MVQSLQQDRQSLMGNRLLKKIYSSQFTDQYFWYRLNSTLVRPDCIDMIRVKLHAKNARRPTY